MTATAGPGPSSDADSATWLSRGERAALDGILSRARPGLGIEIGPTSTGAELIDHCDEVHCLGAPGPDPDANPNPDPGRGAPGRVTPGKVTFHTGEAAELIRVALGELERGVDFALVHGSCSPEGPRAVLEALLDSPALSRTVIIVDQATDERIRRELDAIHYAAWPKVALVDPDFVPGRLLAAEPHELTGGLRLVVLDAGRLRYGAPPAVEERYLPSTPLLTEVRDYITDRERTDGPGTPYGGTPIDPRQARVIDELRGELAHAQHEVVRLRSVARHHEELWRSLMASFSWRVTGPIRAAKERARGGGAGA